MGSISSPVTPDLIRSPVLPDHRQSGTPDWIRGNEGKMRILAQATSAFSSSASSPDSYISIMMSEPPTNSPWTYSCGIVGQSE